MQTLAVVAAMVAVCVTAASAACDKKWTDIAPDHTMCLTPVGTERVLTQAEKDAVVAIHNKYRSEVQPEASNMIKLVWDDDVAEVASRWAAMCKGGHDGGAQRRVPNLPGIGQNGASGYSSIVAATTGWHSEVKYHVYGNGSTTGNWASVGHYTQVVLARSTRIGCGEAICPQGHKSQYCNYVFGQLGSEVAKPYIAGTPCSACPGNCDATGKLCDFNGLTCLNSGSFDIATGTCQCRSMWTGNACQTYYPEGCPTSDKWFCNDKKYQSSGSCPYLFGICKHSCGDKACQNGGTLNYKTCQCSCPNPYQGDLCETANCPKSDAWYCNQEKYQSRGNCPYHYGICTHNCGDLTCAAKGTIDLRVCTCECAEGYSGTRCEIRDACSNPDPADCGWKLQYCQHSLYGAWARNSCPQGCNQC